MCRTAGRAFAAEEKTRTQDLEVPQARQTFAVLGSQPEGWWGYSHGINEHGLALGCTDLRTKLRRQQPGLAGSDLVRLALERCRSARQAVDVLAELVERHGQGGFSGGPTPEGDNAFLAADAGEAFLVEAAGNHWVCQEIREVRAAGNVCTVRQDWDRIARGLAGYAIDQGWWPGDGTKLDFAGSLGEDPTGRSSALRRWGRATLLLEQQNGHIDAAFVRRLLGDHYEGTSFEVDPLAATPGRVPLCQHSGQTGGWGTALSWVAHLAPPPAGFPVVWCAFGQPCLAVFFPVILEGELPGALAGGTQGAAAGGPGGRVRMVEEYLRRDPAQWALARDALGRLQARFDQDADEFVAEAVALKRNGATGDVQRLATLFMQNNLEQFEKVLDGLRERWDQEGSGHKPDFAHTRGATPSSQS
jgi:secernin